MIDTNNLPSLPPPHAVCHPVHWHDCHHQFLQQLLPARLAQLLLCCAADGAACAASSSVAGSASSRANSFIRNSRDDERSASRRHMIETSHVPSARALDELASRGGKDKVESDTRRSALGQRASWRLRCCCRERTSRLVYRRDSIVNRVDVAAEASKLPEALHLVLTLVFRGESPQGAGAGSTCKSSTSQGIRHRGREAEGGIGIEKEHEVLRFRLRRTTISTASPTTSKTSTYFSMATQRTSGWEFFALTRLLLRSYLTTLFDSPSTGLVDGIEWHRTGPITMLGITM